MVCDFCGSSYPDEAKFCPKCGMPALDEKKSPPPQATTPTTQIPSTISSVEQIKKEIQKHLTAVEKTIQTESTRSTDTGLKITGRPTHRQPRWWFITGALLMLPSLLLPWIQLADRPLYAIRLPFAFLLTGSSVKYPYISVGIVLLIVFIVSLRESLRRRRIITYIQAAAAVSVILPLLGVFSGIRQWNLYISNPQEYQIYVNETVKQFDRSYEKFDLFIGSKKGTGEAVAPIDTSITGWRFLLNWCRAGLIFPLTAGLLLLIAAWIFPYSGYRLHLPSTPLSLGITTAICAATLFIIYQFFPSQWFLMQANILEMIGSQQKSITALEACGKLPVPPIRCQMKLGTLYWKNNRTDDALDLLNKINEKYPDYPDVHKSLGDIYFFGKNYWKAINHYRTYWEKYPKDNDTVENLSASLIYVGNSLYEKGRLKVAMRFLKEALLVNPGYRTDDALNLRIGEIHAARGEWKEAAVYYRAVADLQPESFEIQVKTADIYRKAGEYTNAIVFYKRSFQLRPNEASPCVAIGDIYLSNLQNTELAKRWYRKAIEANEFDSAADDAKRKLQNLK
ncbi:MAG: tetratricopeptide repeat protein [bacterium]